jgi:hypothetical protein
MSSTRNLHHRKKYGRLFASALALTGLLSSPPLCAQVNEKFADLAGEIELVRSMAQTERQAVVAGSLTLTADEGQRFWPLYNQHRTLLPARRAVMAPNIRRVSVRPSASLPSP